MNTETRLRDALGAAARTVPDSATGPGLEAAGGRPTTAARRWPLVALAAAAVVIAAAIVPYAILRPEPTRPSTQTSAAVAPPPYFVGFGEGGREARVYSSATGEPVATAPIRPTSPAQFGFVAAAANQRTFYLAALTDTCDSTILRVVLRDDGTVRDVRGVPGGNLDRRAISSLAVSPDGRKLAFGSEQARRSGDFCSMLHYPGTVSVLDLTTGKERTWTGSAKGAPLGLAWAPDNRTIAFLWNESDVLSTVRLLDTTAPGDLLAGRAVTRKPVNQMDLTITADGRSAQVVRWGGDDPNGALVRIDLVTGKVSVVDDRLKQEGLTRVAADASGRHLLAWGSVFDNSNQLVGRRLGRYEDGRVDWFDGTSTVMTFGW
jgi:hypothetical protein